MSDEKQVTLELVLEFMKAEGILDSIPEDEARKAAMTAVMADLNPYTREVFFQTNFDKNKRRNTCTVITGYQVYVRKTEESGLLDYWNAYLVDDNSSLGKYAVYEAKRKDWTQPFRWCVYMSDCAGMDKRSWLWGSKPNLMLTKTAISQGKRLLFADILGRMPYTAEEMGFDMVYQEVAGEAKKESKKSEGLDVAEVWKKLLQACNDNTKLAKAKVKEITGRETFHGMPDAGLKKILKYVKEYAGMGDMTLNAKDVWEQVLKKHNGDATKAAAFVKEKVGISTFKDATQDDLKKALEELNK